MSTYRVLFTTYHPQAPTFPFSPFPISFEFQSPFNLCSLYWLPTPHSALDYTPGLHPGSRYHFTVIPTIDLIRIPALILVVVLCGWL